MTMGPRTKSGEMRALGWPECPACKIDPSKPCDYCGGERRVPVDRAIAFGQKDTDPAPAPESNK
jgi:hypothetical protein